MNKFESLFYWIFAILLIPLTSKDNLKQGQDLANIVSYHNTYNHWFWKKES